MMNDISTKEKILKLSNKLFAENGFNGVSIREIAKVCDVNVAAINYHFKNKENLYAEIVIQSIMHTKESIGIIYENLETKDIEQLAIRTLNHFRVNSENLKTTFKMVMSGDPVCQSIGTQLKNFAGPPGGTYFFNCLKSEFPKANDEDINWAVRIIFTHVIHKAIVMCNHSICDSMAEIGLGEDIFIQDLRKLVAVVKKEIV